MTATAVPLGGLVTIVGGGTPSRKIPEYWDGDIPWATVKDLNGLYLSSTKEHITQKGLDKSASNLIPADSVLMATRMKLGSATINIVAMAINQDLKALLCGPKLEAKYLLYFLQSKAMELVAAGKGATVKGITLDAVHRLQIPLPPLPEQRRIAVILDHADTTRRQRQHAQHRLRDLIPSIFHDMFGDPVRNLRNWPTKQVRQLGRVVTGSTPSGILEGMFGGDIPFITPADLERNPWKPARYVTEAGALEARTVRAGSTLVCCIGATIGKTDKSRQNSAFNQQINAIEWGVEVNDDFGFTCMKQFSSVIINRGRSTALPILKKSSFEQIEIPVPPVELQKQFANRVNRIRALEASYDTSQRHADTLFQSLLQRVFGPGRLEKE